MDYSFWVAPGSQEIFGTSYKRYPSLYISFGTFFFFLGTKYNSVEKKKMDSTIWSNFFFYTELKFSNANLSDRKIIAAYLFNWIFCWTMKKKWIKKRKDFWKRIKDLHLVVIFLIIFSVFLHLLEFKRSYAQFANLGNLNNGTIVSIHDKKEAINFVEGRKRFGTSKEIILVSMTNKVFLCIHIFYYSLFL